MASPARAFWASLFPEKRDSTLSVSDYLSLFSYGGNAYPLGNIGQTLQGGRETIGADFRGYVEGAYKRNGVVFGCMLARLMLFTEARFQFRRIDKGKPGDLFGTPELGVLETPWPNATTGDLLARAIQDVDLAGNFYCLRQETVSGPRLRRLRPDWVTIIQGSKTGDAQALDAELVGYVYIPGGPGSGNDPVTLRPEQVAHWAPIPDPTANYRGMSWLSPVISEVVADAATVEHKTKFFENGATVNLAVSLAPDITKEQFEAWVALFNQNHEGVINAYRTLFLGGGADVKSIGSDMKQVDFTAVQGAGEVRIAMAAGVPPVLAGIQTGLENATYSNYAQARRHFGDATMRPLWRGMCSSLQTIVNVPGGAVLWYDDSDIPFLAEDKKDRADIDAVQAGAIKVLVDSGFEADSVIKAVMSGDFSLLAHTGLFSVQLQPAGVKAGIFKGQVVPAGAPEGAPAAETEPAATPASSQENGKP
jgi:phage portal protein BeeE